MLNVLDAKLPWLASNAAVDLDLMAGSSSYRQPRKGFMNLTLTYRWEHALIAAAIEMANKKCSECYLGRTAIQKFEVDPDRWTECGVA